MSRYQFNLALSGLFHADASRAAAMLPEGLRPLESHPGLAVLLVAVFDFHASEVGAYRELVASVVVSPWAPRGEPLPHAAAFPVALATDTEASRAHAAERWRLPEHERPLSIEFESSADERVALVSDHGEPVLQLRVTTISKLAAARRTYQCFSFAGEHLYRVPIDISGALSVHEDERGSLELGDHPLAAKLAGLLEDPTPFCEECMTAGEQQFGELVVHAPSRRRSA